MKLNSEGFHVFAGCLDSQSDGAKLLNNESAHPTEITILQLDVTKGDDLRKADVQVRSVLQEKNLSLHSIVNNAGIMDLGVLEWAPSKCSVKDYEKVLSVNFLGTVRVTRCFLPLLREGSKESDGGRVVNVASMAARFGPMDASSYCASKWAVAGFSEALNVELDRFGVKVICVEPWFYRTPMLSEQLLNINRTKWTELSDELKEVYDESYLENICAYINTMMKNPFVTTNDSGPVIEAICDAITNLEPDPVVQVMWFPLLFIFKAGYEFLPRDLNALVNKINIRMGFLFAPILRLMFREKQD